MARVRRIAGIHVLRSDQGRAGGDRRRSASASTRSAGERGGITRSRTRSPTICRRREAERHRRRVRPRARSAEIVKDPATAELLHAARPSDRHQAHLRRYRLFRDLQPRQRRRWSICAPDADRGDHGRTAFARRRADFEVDAIVFATGFDAMTGALTSIDIRGRGRRTLRENWAAGPRTYLGLMSRRLPQPVHDHRARQPVGAEQHDRLDRAARRLDRRLPDRACAADAARSSASKPSAEAEDDWVDHVNELAARARSIRRRTPGTWAPTSRASRASSCRMSAASARTAGAATRSPPTAMRDSCSARNAIQPDRANQRPHRARPGAGSHRGEERVNDVVELLGLFQERAVTALIEQPTRSRGSARSCMTLRTREAAGRAGPSRSSVGTSMVVMTSR